MRISKILFIAGLALFIIGIIIAAIPLTIESWVAREEKLVHEIAIVYPLFDYCPSRTFYLPKESINIKVGGIVREVMGRPFDFYALNKLNYERWKAKASYEAYVEAKRVASYNFSLLPNQGGCR